MANCLIPDSMHSVPLEWPAALFVFPGCLSELAACHCNLQREFIKGSCFLFLLGPKGFGNFLCKFPAINISALVVLSAFVHFYFYNRYTNQRTGVARGVAIQFIFLSQMEGGFSLLLTASFSVTPRHGNFSIHGVSLVYQAPTVFRNFEIFSNFISVL